MTDLQTIKYVETICEKNGSIKVENIRQNGDYTLIIPVFNGETGTEQIATLEMESSFDGDWVILYKFPERLLNDEDYNFICECIMDELNLWEEIEQ